MALKMFISYATEDGKFVRELNDALRRELPEIEPIIVEYIKDAGEEFQKQVSNHLDECTWFLALLTENSIGNQWVNQEIGYANALKRRDLIKRFIPVVEKGLEIKGFIHHDMESVRIMRKNLGGNIASVIEYLKSAREKDQEPETSVLREAAQVLERDGLFYESRERWRRAGTLYLEQGSIEEAIEALSQAVELSTKGGWHWEAAEDSQQIANIFSNRDEHDKAVRMLKQAADIYRAGDYAWEAAQTYEKAAGFLVEMDHDSEAIDLYAEAVDSYNNGGYEFEANQCEKKANKIRKRTG